ncbi:hypothetical protein BXZ70DRAFT_1065939 [Cristinia sonorae]|uniref:Fungal-type protein kinase domain-containing protein n=1 Tax=Cristinia sonorae TaxID=1940300 RepID=A0A8K0ULD1_9AGAR|nr:hypothetical protein BXZ70DRAFT_1065939 [Cristinia sonorae]
MQDRYDFINYNTFMKRFFPGDVLPKHMTYDFSTVPDTAFTGAESGLHSYLSQAIQLAFSGQVGQLCVRDTGDWSQEKNLDSEDKNNALDAEQEAVDGMYPDLSIYRTETGEKRSQDHNARSPENLWSDIISFIEVNVDSEEYIPFDEESGQLLGYVSRILQHQHRLSVFSVSIWQRAAYLMHWDRAGVVVTKPFDYTKEPRKLLTFFYRLGRMTDAQLGFDPTVQLAKSTDADVQAMRAYKSAIDYRTRCRDKAFPAEAPVYRVSVPDADGESRSFLIGEPRHTSRSAFGRGTKGFVAYDSAGDEIRFLKTYFRPATATRTESDIYRHLKAKDVTGVTTMLCGGDVHSPADGTSPPVLQQTRTQTYLEQHQTCLIHHRIVTEEVGRPLEEYTSSYELCFVMYDALLGHQSAWENGDVLHRDVSVNNILIHDRIDPETKEHYVVGVLNDWDMSKTRKELEDVPTRGNRSGTWSFMSGLLMTYPRKPFELSDDLESFVHVFLWLALRFHTHDLFGRPGELLAIVKHYFEISYPEEDGIVCGSSEKFKKMRAGIAPIDLKQPSKLGDIIKQLMEVCKNHYQSLDLEKLAQYGRKDILPAEPHSNRQPVQYSSRRLTLPAPTIVPDAIPVPGSSVPTVVRPDLKQHISLISILLSALRQDDWVDNDKVPDQLAGLRSTTTERIGKAQGSTFLSTFQSNSSASRKRKNTGANGGVAAKRKTGETSYKVVQPKRSGAGSGKSSKDGRSEGQSMGGDDEGVSASLDDGEDMEEGEPEDSDDGNDGDDPRDEDYRE